MSGHGLESLIPKKNISKPAETISSSVAPLSVNNPPQSAVKPVDYVRFDEQARFNKPSIEPKRYREESIFQIEIEKIKPNPFQPRREFNQEKLEELAQSIREFGILQPIVVSKVIHESNSGALVEYQLIAGERRLMASKLAGLERIPAIVRKVDDHRTKLELALLENIQRSDLNAVESARGYARLQEEFGLTQREIAARLGKSREVIANTLRLLNLPLSVQSALAEGKINESQARTLLSLNSQKDQQETFERILDQKISVRALHEEVIRKEFAPNPENKYWEKRLEEKIGAPVQIKKQGNRGKVVMPFYSEEELRGLINKLLGSEGEASD